MVNDGNKIVTNSYNMKERNTNIEILRLILMIAIFGWHILVHGYDYKNVESMQCLGGYNLLTFCFLSSLLAPATYCFMFISGFYGLNFSVKKALNLELWLIMTCLIVYLLKFMLDFHFHFGMRGLLTCFIPISSSKWWFMTNYVLVMIMSPIINKGFGLVNKKTVSIILTLLIVYQYLSFVKLIPSGGSNFLSLLTMYLIGRYCSIYNININRNKSILLFVLLWILQFSFMLLCGHFIQKILFRTLNYNTPFIMMMSISLFYIFKGMVPKYSKRINYCCQSVLFVYLFTENLGPDLYRAIRYIIDDSVGMGISVSFLTIVGCLIVGRLIMWLSNRLLQSTIYRYI